uniref:hypothetical protein n=1 Tax=Enterocloster clostridioformis TaxID=1531 RepID=UPI001C3CC284|nr:hypothetical protein [Enterocloster clostridioformis]
MGENRNSDGESIAELYRDIYEQAAEMGTVGEPEVTRSIVETDWRTWLCCGGRRKSD